MPGLKIVRQHRHRGSTTMQWNVTRAGLPFGAIWKQRDTRSTKDSFKAKALHELNAGIYWNFDDAVAHMHRANALG